MMERAPVDRPFVARPEESASCDQLIARSAACGVSVMTRHG
jgi:hypothetical protein